jgi:hypothetical protein
MKNTFEITREQILELEADGLSYVRQWFPQAFELEVGKWYKRDGEFLFNFQGKYSVSNDSGSYGFSSNNNWWENIGVDKRRYYPPATEEEVKTALIAEAKKRGFEGTTRIDWKFGTANYSITRPDLSYFEFKNNCLTFACGVVFQDGKWCEIITQPLTIEERLTKLELRWTDTH